MGAEIDKRSILRSGAAFRWGVLVNLLLPVGTLLLGAFPGWMGDIVCYDEISLEEIQRCWKNFYVFQGIAVVVLYLFGLAYASISLVILGKYARKVAGESREIRRWGMGLIAIYVTLAAAYFMPLLRHA